jgi:hypothetical protein
MKALGGDAVVGGAGPKQTLRTNDDKDDDWSWMTWRGVGVVDSPKADQIVNLALFELAVTKQVEYVFGCCLLSVVSYSRTVCSCGKSNTRDTPSSCRTLDRIVGTETVVVVPSFALE